RRSPITRLSAWQRRRSRTPRRAWLFDALSLLDNNFNECWLQGSESSTKRVVHVFRTVDVDGLATLSPRDGTEVDVGKVRANMTVEAKVLPELDQRFVAPVVYDDKCNGQAQLCRGPQALDRIEARAVTEQGNHFLARSAQGDTDGRRQCMSQPATRACIERVPREYRQV